MKEELKIEYVKRLSTPYEKNGKQECFKQQYLHGKGNELKKKVLEPHEFCKALLRSVFVDGE